MLMLRLAQPSSQGGVLDKVAARAAQWALATKCERGSATEEERMAHDELVRDLELGLSRQHCGMSVETVDDGAVLQMLRALVRVMTAFAQRARTTSSPRTVTCAARELSQTTALRSHLA